MIVDRVKALSLEEKDAALALLLGWKKWQDEESGVLAGDWSKSIWTPPDNHRVEVAVSCSPSFCTDLNEVRKVAKTLSKAQHKIYRDWLAKLNGVAWYQSAEFVDASAEQRTIALILTLSL